MSTTSILVFMGACLTLQLGALWLYLRAYRRVRTSMSAIETEWIAPAILPLGGLVLWGLGMFDYSQVYGWQQALKWTWWQPVGALVGLLAGRQFSRWYNRRELRAC